MILISNLVRTIRLAGKIAKDEEEAAVREAIREIQEKRQKEKKILQIKNNKTGFIRRKITWQEVYN